MDLTRAVPLLSVAAALGVLVRFAPLPRLAGAYINEPGSRPGILVNTRHPRSKQRYTLAHEIGHHVLGHATSLDADTELLPDGGTLEEERLAEAFASWLLMPRVLVRYLAKALSIGSSPNEVDIYRLSLRLGASYLATIRHLANLRMLDAAESTRMAAIAPQVIKVRLASGGPGVGAADVHLITRREATMELIVTAGDLVVFEGTGGRAPVVDASGLATSVKAGSLFDETRVVLRVVEPGPQNPSQPPLRREFMVDDGAGRFSVHLVVEPLRHGVAEHWFRPPEEQP